MYPKKKLKTAKFLSSMTHHQRTRNSLSSQSKECWQVHLWPNHNASQKCKRVNYFILCTKAKVYKKVSWSLQWRTGLDIENRLSAKQVKTIAMDGTPSKTKAIPQKSKLHSPSVWLRTREENGSGWKLQKASQGSAHKYNRNVNQQRENNY